MSVMNNATVNLYKAIFILFDTSHLYVHARINAIARSIYRERLFIFREMRI